MIPKECKRLIEVDFPIAEVSRQSAREKSIRHGHPCTLHLWWARRPLAACRAVLLGLLLPDPCDPHCPEEFKPKAWEALKNVRAVADGDEALQRAILKFIADFANWDNSDKQAFLRAGRGLVKAAYPEEPPLVVDPFAGGGSIPLEALRVGCDAFASDLNPVACLILKVLLEDIPRHGPELADELRQVGQKVKNRAIDQLRDVYPPDPDGSVPIAYLWARTVSCESPQCGAEIPLVRSFWLSRNKRHRRALRPQIVEQRDRPPHVEFELIEPQDRSDVHKGTVSRAKATCLCCGKVLPPDRVRAQLRQSQGGTDVVFDKDGNRVGGTRLLAVVRTREGESGRTYRLAAKRDYDVVLNARQRLETTIEEWQRGGHHGFCPVPDEPLPDRNTLGLRVPNYGFLTWGDLFSARQKLLLSTLAGEISGMEGEHAHLQPALALAVSRTADYCSANCSLHSGRDVVRNTWARNALPIVWDYYEACPLAGGSGSFDGALDWIARVVERMGVSCASIGSVQNADACESPVPDDSASVWFTDPPYYNAIGYAESSDFFLVWLKRCLSKNLPAHFDDSGDGLSPKHQEAIEDDTFEAVYGLAKDRDFFEDRIFSAFAEGHRIVKQEGIGSVVFAHKTTEGWEALLSGVTRTGWVITGSWPIHTEMANKVSAMQAGEKKAMLLASIHLVCRPRPADAPIGDWEDVYKELPTRVGEWMERLQGEGIRGADLVFACIGPALEIYSRYSKVVDAQDREIPLGGDPEAAEPHKRGYLAYVWEAVGRAALQQILGEAEATARNGFSGALEEDSRLTALFLWTLQSTEARMNDESEGVDEEEVKKASRKGFSLPFDVVRRFAQPLGIHLDEWADRVVETKKGIVRLVPVRERAEQLFGADGADAVADEIEARPQGPIQLSFLPAEEDAAPEVRGRRRRRRSGAADEDLTTDSGATTLDRVHAAMLLQAGGRTNALRALLKSEQDRGPEFMRLANALSALYPRGSEEKRLLDAMLLAAPR